MAVIILTGPPGVGKNTIAEAAAGKQATLAVIDVDTVRQMVVNPHKAPWEGEEGRRQQLLGVRNACTLAKNFLKSGFDVLILDVVSDEASSLYKHELGDIHPKVVLLLPTFHEIQKRNQERPPKLKPEEIDLLYQGQKALTNFDQKIDNTSLSPEKVANILFTN